MTGSLSNRLGQTIKHKPKSDTGTPKQSRSKERRDSYQKYLHKPNKEDPTEDKTSTALVKKPIKITPTSRLQKQSSTKKSPDIRIIKQADRSKSKNKFTRTSKKPGKEDDRKNIFKIQMQLQDKKPEATKTEAKEPDKIPEATKPDEIPEAKEPDKIPEATKPEATKPEATKPEAKKPRRRSQRGTKRHKHMKTRKVKINRKKISSEDLKRIEQKIMSIRNKRSKDIKSALEKDGIKVSGKSSRLLKDIYFYSKVCNINIKHEE